MNQHHRRAPRPPTTKTQKSDHPKPCHPPPRASVVSEKSPMCCLRFLTSKLSSWHMRRPNGLLVHWSTKLEKSGRLSRLHALPTFRILPTHRHDFLMCSSSIRHTRCPIGHVNHRSTYGRNMAFNCCCTCLHAPLRFLASPPCVDGTPTRRNLLFCHPWRHLMMLANATSAWSMSTLARH